MPVAPDPDPVIVPAFISSAPLAGMSSGFNEDLARVRVVVEAAGGGGEVAWAAGMVVTSGRRQVVVTTDRGLSWLPECARLPADVAFPWGHDDAARWEGIVDPARVILEYAAAVDGELSALASTYSSAPAVAAGVPFVFADGTDRAYPEMLTGPVKDRVQLRVDAGLQEQARQRTDRRDQRQTVWSMAWDASGQAPQTPTQTRMIAVLVDHGGRIDNPRWVAALPWADLEAEYRELCVQERAARVDVRDLAVGDVDTEGGLCRPLLRQCYAIECLLALRHSSAQEALQSGLYSWWMQRKITPAAPPMQSHLVAR
jgi:hypothetical protein